VSQNSSVVTIGEYAEQSLRQLNFALFWRVRRSSLASETGKQVGISSALSMWFVTSILSRFGGYVDWRDKK
jgi:hypothetical protein